MPAFRVHRVLVTRDPLNLTLRCTCGASWPTAAWGDHTGEFAAPGVTLWPRVTPTDPIEKFLDDAAPLSARASAGFLKRARAGSLRFVAGFLDDVEAHLATMTTLERSA